MLRRLAQRGGGAGERGSVAVFTAFFAFAVLLLVALLVVGGSVLNARERAADIAEQAARAAVTDLSTARLHAGVVAIDWGTACGYALRAVRDYAADFSNSSVRMTYCGEGGNANPRTATVTVQVTIKPAFPGFPAPTMTATQTATAACGNANQQEVC